VKSNWASLDAQPQVLHCGQHLTTLSTPFLRPFPFRLIPVEPGRELNPPGSLYSSTGNNLNVLLLLLLLQAGVAADDALYNHPASVSDFDVF